MLVLQNGGVSSFLACMANLNPQRLKNRRERLALWRVAAGQCGLISAGNAAWLLDCSATYVHRLLRDGKLVSRTFGGQRLILFSSLAAYCETSPKVCLR